VSDFFNRLVAGGMIDRGKPLKFWFNGKSYEGFAGDTLASALLSNGVLAIGQSVRRKRPRAIVGSGRDEPNAFVLVETGRSGERFAPATLVELYDGLRARVADRPAPPLDWPDKAGRKASETGERRAIGYGKTDKSVAGRPTETRLDHCDVLIVGGGPAGLAAAKTAASANAKVLLVERERTFGGDLRWDDLSIDGKSAQQWISAITAELDALDNVTLLRSATAAGYYEQNLVHVVERLEEPAPTAQSERRTARRTGFRLRKVRAAWVVLATGASEQILVLPDNDVPGVMLASAVRHYLRRFAVLAGRQAIIVTDNDSAYRTALDLAEIGVKVMAVVDSRESPQSDLPAAARQKGIEILPGSVVTAIRGKTHVTGVVVAAVDERGQPSSRGTKEFDCDLVCLSGGWQPDLDLFNESAGDVLYDAVTSDFRPDDHPNGTKVAGAAAGLALTRDCIQNGYEAGRDAAEAVKSGIAKMPRRPATPEGEPTPPRAAGRPAASSAKASADKWIDLSGDVTLDDVDAAVKEHHHAEELIAARTGLFRGPDGGLASALSGRVILGEALSLAPDGLGERPVWPIRPIPLQAYAPWDSRRRFRTLPTLQVHLDAAVRFQTYRGWTLPACYSRAGEHMNESIRRETVAAQNGITLFDTSASAKIEVSGRDAAAFLDKMVTVDIGRLSAGSAGDGFILDDAGMILDRCRVARLGDSYLVIGSIGLGDVIERWFQQWHQLGWNTLAVFLTDVSAKWSAFSIAGPRVADLLAKLLGRAEAPAAMTCMETVIADYACRIFADSRLEIPEIEIHAPAGVGSALWTRLAVLGADIGICPIGVEARNVIAMESGGLPLDTAYGARWSPIDFGPVDALAGKTEDFIGKRMALAIASGKTVRPQLVVILPENEDLIVPAGAVLLNGPAKRESRASGYVIGGQISPKLGRALAIGFLDTGRAKHGDKVMIYLDGKAHPARIAPARTERAHG
jgi:sarcosine oxidase, subunit alpha